MKLHINIESINEGASEPMNEGIYIDLKDSKDLKTAVVDYCVNAFRWKTILSFNVVARIDGACRSIDRVHYLKQSLNVVCAKEKFVHANGASQLVWFDSAKIFPS